MNMANISNKATVDVAVRESSLSREINISKSQNEQTFRDTLGGTDGNATENLFTLHGRPVGQLSSISSEAATTAGVISQDPIIEGARERDKDDRNLTVCPTGAILSQRAQELIDQINSKRKQDTQMMADFNKVLDMHVQKSCSSIEQMMFLTYEKEGKMIQDKLQELFATLDRIKKLEDELNQFKQALGILYQDVPTQAQE